MQSLALGGRGQESNSLTAVNLRRPGAVLRMHCRGEDGLAGVLTLLWLAARQKGRVAVQQEERKVQVL